MLVQLELISKDSATVLAAVGFQQAPVAKRIHMPLVVVLCPTLDIALLTKVLGNVQVVKVDMFLQVGLGVVASTTMVTHVRFWLDFGH